MQVFNNYFRILNKNKKSIFLYLCIFLALTFAFASSGDKNSGPKDFEISSINVAVFDEDGSTASKGLVAYLNKECNVVDVEDDELKIQDAMFYSDIEYAVRIKKGYEEQLHAGAVTTVETTKNPNSFSSSFIDTKINSYVGTLTTYLQNGQDLESALTKTIDNLKVQTEVSLETENEMEGSNPPYVFFYQYLSYLFTVVLTLGMGIVLIQFNETEIKRRSLCASISQFSYNAQLILGSAIFAIIVWAIMNVVAIASYHNQTMFFENLPYNMANSFASVIVSLSLGFFAGSVVKTNNAANGIANTFSLGLSFLGGVFVPQELMDPSILKVAQFVPTYWYVKTVNVLADGGVKTTEIRNDVFMSIAIQFGFAIAIFAIALLIKKIRQKDH